MKINCDNCGKQLNRKPSRIKRNKHNLCDFLCISQWKFKNRIKVKCSWCGKTLFRLKCQIKGENSFCDIPCYGKWTSINQIGNKHNLGKPLSKETKKKISKAHIGIKPNDETRKKMSKIAKLRTGEKSNNWKGGATSENDSIRTSIEYRLWREAVFSRDNWTCQKCSKRGFKIEAHHIKLFSTHPELRVAIDNGVTYCKSCHRNKHRRKKAA